MRISTEIIEAIGTFVCGAMLEETERLRAIPYNSLVNNGVVTTQDNDVIGKVLTPYRSGQKLVQLFNEFGTNDDAIPADMSRKLYTTKQLQRINGTHELQLLIEYLFLPITYECEGLAVSDAVAKANQYLKHCEFELVEKNGKYEVAGNGLIESEIVEVRPVFENIQAQIIQALSDAKYLIWVAVAWFTDEKIFEKLIEKKNEGLNIQIIVCNDDMTKQHGLPYGDHFEAYRINEFGAYANNILHNKFCIVDLNTVLHGSYNWTKKAAYNFEEITTIASYECASHYADRFIELKNIALHQQ